MRRSATHSRRTPGWTVARPSGPASCGSRQLLLATKRARHAADRCGVRQAATDARKALAGYQALLTELDANGSQTRIAELAGQAAQRVGAYEGSLEQAIPVKNLLETGVPTGQRLAVPIDEINRLLIKNGSSQRLTTDAPIPEPGAEYRRLMSPDGMVFTVDGAPDDDVTKVAEVRLRMKPRDLTEVIDRDYDLAEQMSGTLGEGGQSIGTTSTHSSNTTVGVNVQPFLALAAPGTPLHAASQVFAPRGEVSTGRTLAETGGATAHHQSGWVDDNRGESLLYEWSGEWEIEVRNSPTEPGPRSRRWTRAGSSPGCPAPTRSSLPTETVSLAELGRAAECTTDFPRYAVDRDQWSAEHQRPVGHPRPRASGAGSTASLTTTSVSSSPRTRTGCCVRPPRPGGITRPIPSGGETEYALTLEVEPVWADAKLSGEASSEMWQEEVLVDFAGVNAGQTYGTSLTGTASVAYPGKPIAGQPVPGYMPSPKALSDVGTSSADVSPSVSIGRNVSRQGGQNVSSTSITPAVHRNQGPTQGVIVGLRVKATLRKINDRKAEPIVVSDLCEAHLRVPENDLLRAGGRADKNAVRREPDGTMRTDQDKRALLRGDPEPPTGPQTLPPWLGTGPNQLRGPGKALPQRLQGAEETQRQALVKLSQMGLVPPLDSNLQPQWDKLPRDPLRRASQLRNYDRITQQINAPRIEAGMNQACQGGLIVVLDDLRTGQAPHYRPFRLVRHPGLRRCPGPRHHRVGEHRPARHQLTGHRADVRAVEVGADLGWGRRQERSGPRASAAGPAGSASSSAGSALGRSFSWTVGRRVNRVTLNESSAQIDRLRQGGRITFAEVTDKGDSEPLADVQRQLRGRVRQRADPGRGAGVRGGAEGTARRGRSAGDPGRGRRGQPGGPDLHGRERDPRGLQRLPAAAHAPVPGQPGRQPGVDERRATSCRWPSSRHRQPGPGLEDRTLLPQQLTIGIRGKATSLTYAATSEQNTVDINFTMTDVGSTSGTSSGGGVSADGGGGVVGADGSGWSGSASIGRTGGGRSPPRTARRRVRNGCWSTPARITSSSSGTRWSPRSSRTAVSSRPCRCRTRSRRRRWPSAVPWSLYASQEARPAAAGRGRRGRAVPDRASSTSARRPRSVSSAATSWRRPARRPAWRRPTPTSG